MNSFKPIIIILISFFFFFFELTYEFPFKLGRIKFKEVQLKISKLPEKFSRFHLPKPNEPIIIEDSSDISWHEDEHIDRVIRVRGLVPQSVYKMGTEFYMYTRKKERRVKFEETKICLRHTEAECSFYPLDLGNLQDVLDFNKRTVMIVGGYLTSAPSDWQEEMRDRWLDLEDVNVIIVAWNKGNKGLYSTAVANTKIVARQATVFLYYLAKMNNIDLNDDQLLTNFLLIGHSLGAHICGFIGQDFGGKLGRITGLDPAGPYFTNNEDYHRLDRNDAQLVDIIHTNADKGWNFFLGIYSPIGHIDYYANDGKWQPNCGLHNFFSCNHIAVTRYYISILEHELVIRGLFEETNAHGDHRLLAYPSETFLDFKTGATIRNLCNTFANEKFGSASYMSDNVRQCAIPMDFFKPPSTFRKELQDTYDVNFSFDHESNRKYYFFTSPDLPYVVDHNILRVKLHLDKEHWSKKQSCNIKIGIKMDNNRTTESTYNDYTPPRSVSDDDSFALTFPFVSLNRSGKYKLDDLDVFDFFIPQNDMEELQLAIASLFPTEIDIRTMGSVDITNKEESLLERVDQLGQPEWVANPVRRFDCDFKMQSIQVQPLKVLGRIFVAIYTLQGNMRQQPRIMISDDIKMPQIDVMGRKSNGSDQIYSPPAKFYIDTVMVGPREIPLKVPKGRAKMVRLPSGPQTFH